MPTTGKKRFWRLCRIYFRRFRISIWLVTIFLLATFLYLNRVGLPDFVKRPLVNALRERGVDLEFDRLRLHWAEGFVADTVRFGSMTEAAAPHLYAEKARLKLNLAALVRGRLQVDALALYGGHLEWRPANLNAPIRALTVTNISAQLRLLPGDQWRLDDLRARFAGADFLVTANVTNASAVADWDFLEAGTLTPDSPWPERLQRLADRLESITFASPPELRLVFEGDARDLQSFGARLNLNATHADTPWGQAENVEFVSRLFPASASALSHAEIDLTAANARTPWANVTNLQLQLRLLSLALRPESVDAALTLRADATVTPWAHAGRTQVKAAWTHAVTNPIPRSGHVEVDTVMVQTRWARAAGVQFAGSLVPASPQPATNASLSWWNFLLPYQLEWSAEARGATLTTPELSAEIIRLAGQWHAPTLLVTNLHAELYRGLLEAGAQLDIGTRELTFAAASDFDIRQLAPLLTPTAQNWLARLSGVESPRLQCAGAVVLPAWTNRQPDWRGEVQPTLRLAGEVGLTNAAFQGIHADWLHTHFACTNLVWQLPDLTARRPEGEVRLTHWVNETTTDFYLRFRSTLDLTVARPLLTEPVQRGLDWCEFTTPPVIAGELWGHGADPDRLGFRGHAALTNFTFRGLVADAVVAEVRYTNRAAQIIEPRLWRGTQNMSATGVTADFNAQRVYITNGFGRFDPRTLTRAIGPEVDDAIAPYNFLEPPTVRVEGYAPMKDEHDADLLFVGEGGPFETWKFRATRVGGRVHWYKDTLTLTNIQAELYGGTGAGWGHFRFIKDQPGASFAFGVNTINTDLRLLMEDLVETAEDLEGRLNLNLLVTDAHTEDARSWNGRGDARLRDGLIWEIPIFGVLSKPLDSLMPGLGNSRVSEASASYIIANSVIRSDDLEMRAPTMRLQYRGTVDFAGHVQARVTAEPLRGTPVLGPLVNLALWPVTKLLEYQITGTLAEPKSEPVYIPKLLLIPFSPFKTLEELFTPTPQFTTPPPLE